MRVFYINDLPALHIDWEVLKGKCDVREDFDGASIAMFLLCGGNGADLRRENRIALGVTVADNGHLTADIPLSVLNVQVYGLRLLWTKDGEIPTALDDMNTESRCGRCRVNISEKFDIFAVTDYEREADSDGYGDVTINIRSHSAVYGKDGLDAYELAVLRGYTMMTEAEWLQSRTGVSVSDEEGTSVEKVATQRVVTAGLNELREGKVDKVSGKGLSANDYTDTEKAKLGALPTSTELASELGGKVDKVEGKVLSDNNYTNAEKGKLAALPVNAELQTVLEGLEEGKVDKESGKGLSTNDYTTSEKQKLAALPTGSQLSASLASKVDAETGKGLSTNDYTTAEKNKLAALPTAADLTTSFGGKVDKVTGKGLSTNDYTTEEKNKLGALPTNSQLQSMLTELDDDKVDKVSGKGLSTNDYTDGDKAKLSELPDNDTLEAILDELDTDIGNKVDKVTGKGLSANDYTDTEKAKLAALPVNVELQAALDALDDGKVDKVSGKGLSANDYTTAEKTKLTALPTATELNAALAPIGNKVDKVTGKGLSTNDYTDTEKEKLSALPTAASLTSSLTALDNGKVNVVSGKGLSTNDYTSEEKQKLESYPDYEDMDERIDALDEGKVDKVSGKGLSTNDYTTSEKQKLAALPTNATLQTALSGKVSGAKIGAVSLTVTDGVMSIPVATSNNSGVITGEMYDGLNVALQDVSDLQSDMATAQQDISSHGTALTRIDGNIDDIEDDVDELQTNVGELREGLSLTIESVGELDVRLDGLEGTQINGAKIGNTQLAVSDHKVIIPQASTERAGVLSNEDYYKFASYEDEIEVISTSVSVLNSTLTQHAAAINNLGNSKVNGAKIGNSSLVVDSNRMIEIPVATTSSAGVVKVDGSSITINNGVITAHTSGGGGVTVVNSLESTSTTDALSANMGHELKGITDSLADNLDGVYTSLDETLGVALDAYNKGIWTASVGSQSIPKSNNNLNLPLATASQFGMVKVGSGLSVSNGVISTSGGGGTSTIVVNGSSTLDEGDTLGTDTQGRTVLPLASASGYGLVKVDNSTVGITNGKLGVLNSESFKWILGNVGSAYPTEDEDVLNILGYDPTSQEPEDSPIETKVDYTDDNRGFVAIKLNVGSGLTVEDGVLKATGGGDIEVIDNLSTPSSTDALSANMGVELKNVVYAREPKTEYTQHTSDVTSYTSYPAVTQSEVHVFQGNLASLNITQDASFPMYERTFLFKTGNTPTVITLASSMFKAGDWDIQPNSTYILSCKYGVAVNVKITK